MSLLLRSPEVLKLTGHDTEIHEHGSFKKGQRSKGTSYRGRGQEPRPGTDPEECTRTEGSRETTATSRVSPKEEVLHNQPLATGDQEPGGHSEPAWGRDSALGGRPSPQHLCNFVL